MMKEIRWITVDDFVFKEEGGALLHEFKLAVKALKTELDNADDYPYEWIQDRREKSYQMYLRVQTAGDRLKRCIERHQEEGNNEKK